MREQNNLLQSKYLQLQYFCRGCNGFRMRYSIIKDKYIHNLLLFFFLILHKQKKL